MSAFVERAHGWNRLGWGALPLPPAAKFPPPTHWTGHGAPYPSAADVEAWMEEFPEANLGLRMPANVIGIDVDDYTKEGSSPKTGRSTLLAHTATAGKLPRTVRITSRTHNISGIYLFRLPEGVDSTKFRGELPGGGVEIIRAGHRYAVGPGSLHPEGRRYYLDVPAQCAEMVRPDGDTAVVHPDDLPVLPAAWVEVLTVTPAASDPEAAPVELTAGRGDRYAKSAVDAVVAELQSIANWPVGKTDDRGRGWEKIQADAALRLASLAIAEWNTLTVEQAGQAFGAAAPQGGDWGPADVAKKWRSQLARAEPASPPKDSTDPLSPGYQPPPSVAAALWPAVPTGAPAVDPFAHAAEEPAVSAAVEALVEDVPPAVIHATPQVAAEWVKHSWDDRGNAERVIAMFGSRLRWIPQIKAWLRYSAEVGTWQETSLGGERAALEMIDELAKLEGPLYSKLERKKGDKTTSDFKEFLDWWATQRFAARYAATASTVRISGILDESVRAFDADPNLINCRNGVLDLTNGQLLPHEPGLLLRRQAPVNYDPEADCPRWDAFLARALPDAEMRDYLQRVVGYSITGLTGEQVMFIHQGPPATGKSVFLRTIEAMLGDFSRVVPPTTLLTKKNEAHPTDIMGLEGRRFLQVSETPEGARLEEALVKRLSGEETITARGMGQDFRDFRITGKVHLVTNHLPHISDDPATQRRIHLIQWNEVIPPDERVQGLADAFISEELEGIFAWAVRGALMWRKEHLSRPTSAHLAALDYFEEEDEFGDFLTEKLVASQEAWTPTAQLFRYYSNWCDSSKVKPMSKVAFSRKLSKRGFETVKSGSVRGFRAVLATDPILQGNIASEDPFAPR